MLENLLEKLFDLRNAQSNAPADKRADFEPRIAELLQKINEIRG